MKRIPITVEVREKIALKIIKYLQQKHYLIHNGAGSGEFNLWTTYITASTIREDIYEELCGTI